MAVILGRPSTTAEPTAAVRLALVNNMPDAAFEETEQQFQRLLERASGNTVIELRRYVIADIARGPAVAEHVARSYGDLDALYRDRPDALVVTGTEPLCADLRHEPYWSALEQLLVWAEDSASSALLSCLAGHAAVLSFDGVARQPLATKRSGVYRQDVDGSHPLSQGLDSVAFPHSRLNDIPASTMQAHGYRLVLTGANTGWTVATREQGSCLFVLLQGHPEYAPATLLREYRRDVRRYLEGERPDLPAIPEGYLDDVGTAALEAFVRRVAAGGETNEIMDDFPMEEAAGHLRWDWQEAAGTLIGNWLTAVADRRRVSSGISPIPGRSEHRERSHA